MPTQAKENYLKAIYFLDQQNSQVNITELSKRMGVRKPTTTNMVKSLQEKGWVIYKKYQPIRLTPKGRKEAALIIRKHRLAEMFLYEIMGFGWEEVHDIAEEMEHLNSDAFFDRMDEILDYPEADPHGSPIPNAKGHVAEQKYVNLTTIPPGQKVVLRALTESPEHLLHYLNENNIALGDEIEIKKVEPYDESRWITCNGKGPIMISQKVSKRLLVDPV